MADLASPDLVADHDGQPRCPWAGGNELLAEYHDREWGRELHGRDALYERISLEAFQSGLSWLVVLRKRPAFREAFAGFDPERVAAFDDADLERLLSDAGIVRNRAKIVATVENARAVLDLDTDLDALLWSFAPHPRPSRPTALTEVPATTEASRAMAKALRARGFRFVGPTTCYAMMQATGMVDDHLAGCVGGAPRTQTRPDDRSDVVPVGGIGKNRGPSRGTRVPGAGSDDHACGGSTLWRP